MFNFSEIIFIGVLALILIGPKQLPEVARIAGRWLNEFRRASDVLMTELKKTPRPIEEKPKDHSEKTFISTETTTKNKNDTHS